jgi:glycopeptide antibiotics resistance protein
VSRPAPARGQPPAVPVPAARWAAAAYAALLAAVTVLPVRWRPDLARFRGNWRPQLVPVWNLLAGLADGDRRLAVLAGLAGNLALFVPLGFLLPLVATRFDRLWRVVAAGVAVSVAVELVQLAFPGVRRPDVNDVLANGLGAAAGFLAYRLAVRRGRGRPPTGA